MQDGGRDGRMQLHGAGWSSTPFLVFLGFPVLWRYLGCCISGHDSSFPHPFLSLPWMPLSTQPNMETLAFSRAAFDGPRRSNPDTLFPFIFFPLPPRSIRFSVPIFRTASPLPVRQAYKSATMGMKKHFIPISHPRYLLFRPTTAIELSFQPS